ncbi:ABC transporter ATP-binding protein [Ornithinimicrobium ciconiae]|uniref:ABC transporter ATP-binding protein n=1 Tax=Ornithinimicrobium ciconiae TaxID=2594265 RepID=A0A516G828_9MICO|nr:ABC transporter ATP-binding protein [Ornithinimicrobium ciconiae]QDO87679.1 ABC transporter ATP-binding protein [Ornithinimicrobium ciconiae]
MTGTPDPHATDRSHDPRETGLGGGLTAYLPISRGRFRLEAQLDVPPGQVVALIGPNGAGKSTVLHALAGLLRLRDGVIALDGRLLDEPASGTFVPPQRRDVGVVFQDYLLFPHLSALENVAFGPRARGLARGPAREEARTWLERVGLASHAGSRPAQLSGGQAQRVALARALATRPQLVLLDEPLAALDAGTRLEVRSDLARHLREFGGSAVMVTHDPLDAMVVADRIVVLENGQIVQDDAPAEVARAPRTEYVARLVGLNLHRGQGDGATVRLDAGGVLHVADAAAGPVLVAFPPTSVTVHRHQPEGSARNVWRGTIAGLEQHAHTIRVQVAAPEHPPVLADVTPAAVAELELAVGADVWVSFKATDTHVYPGATH